MTSQNEKKPTAKKNIIIKICLYFFSFLNYLIVHVLTKYLCIFTKLILVWGKGHEYEESSVL